MLQDKKSEQNENSNANADGEETSNVKEEDLHKEIKNANASGMGSLGRSDETIEKPEGGSKEDNTTPY